MKTKLLSFAVASSLLVAGASFAQTKTTTTKTESSYGSQPKKMKSSKTTRTKKSSAVVAPAVPAETVTTESTTSVEPAPALDTSAPAGTYSGSSAPVMGGTTYGANEYREKRSLRTENFSFSPQIGTVVYTDQTGQADSRASIGVGMNFNFLRASAENPQNSYVGISTGTWFSHLGSPNANFWGAADHSTFDNGANMVIIPADLKLGMNFGESFRASIRGGGNVIYRNVPQAALLGSGSGANVNEWAILPNAGLDLEWQVADGVALIARPDLTIAPGNNMFVGTLGASIHPF